MKLRRDTTDVTDAQEQELEASVRRLASQHAHEEPAPAAAYFANVMVKTNETIDHVTSGKALSISWLARVAVPGVVAILFFFIGLHYYKPEMSNAKNTATEAVNALPQNDVDSMVATSLFEGEQALDIFSVTSEQLAEYFVNSHGEAALLETIPEHQLNEVATILETKNL